MKAPHYISVNFALCAIPKGQKGPRTPGWNRPENAIRTDKQARGINGSNIGLLHEFSGTWALDIDDMARAVPWLAERGTDLAQHLNAPDAVQIVSGRAGRAKLLYRLPEGCAPLPTFKVANGALEFRCAGVQDVLPPSIHPETGKPYEWRGDYTRLPLAPAALLALYQSLVAAPPKPTPAADGKIAAGQRHDALLRLAGAMRRQGATADEIEAALLKQNERCDPPEDAAEVRRIARSVTKYAPEATHTAPSLVRVEVGELHHAVPDPVHYVIQSLLPRGVVSLLAGHGGAGKSLLSLTIAAHVAAGRAFGGLQTTQAPVLIASLEDAAAMVRYRLRRIIETFGLDPQAVAQNVLIADGSDADPALAVEVNEFGVRKLTPTAAFDQLREFSADRRLVIVDGASDAYDGDENSRRQVRAFIRLLASIARGNDASVLLLAHIDKNAARFGGNGNAYSGSTAWHNSVRVRLALTDVEDGFVELRMEKNNLGRKIDALRFQWSDSGVLIPASERPVGTESDDDCADVFAAIAAANTAGVDVPTARSGPATAYHALSTLPELPKRLRTKAGRERFWHALTVLARGGSIEVEQFKGASRHLRERYRARQSPVPPHDEHARLARGSVSADSAGQSATRATGATGAEDKEWF